MPNCDFYAAPDDHAHLLDWLFAEGTCHVYELYSDHGCELQRFSSGPDVMAQFERTYETGEKWANVNLNLYVLGAGPPFEPRIVLLDPKACNGATYRYAAEGWGLVQLYLGGRTPHGSLRSSHTNHFTQKGAAAWALVGDDQPGIDSRNFRKVTAFSSRLNREIRKRSVGKHEGRVILPGAFELWRAGASLLL